MIKRFIALPVGFAIALSAGNCFGESRQITVTDSEGKSHTVQQNTRNIGDDQRVILPGDRPERLKKIHEDICSSLNGESVSGDGVTTLHGDAIDAVTCHIPSKKEDVKKKNDDATSRLIPESEDSQSSSSAGNPISGPYLYINPPHQTVQTGYRFRVKGNFDYVTNQGGRYNSTMKADNCGASKSGMIPEDASGNIYMSVLCQAFDSGTYETSLQACIPGLCATGRGVITAQ